MRLVDSHCHLQSDRFADDLEAVLQAARDVGVERILVPGWDGASSRAAVELAASHATLDAAAGIHPHDAGRAAGDDWSSIGKLARDPNVVAVGETGLDYDRMYSPIAAQRANLERHLELGLELGRPVIIHCRSAAGEARAHDDLLELLDDAGIRPEASGRPARPAAVIHSFSGSAAFADEVLARGLAISISGLAFRGGEEATFGDVAARVPIERLLVETDSPYLPPPGAPRRRNEPAWVGVTAERLAAARSTTLDELGPELVAAYDAIFAPAS